MDFVGAWARAFALTCAIELLVAVPLLKVEAPWPRRAAVVLFAQLASHPAVWFVFPELPLGLGYPGFLVIVELWAIVLEAVFYRVVLVRLSWTLAFGIATLANGASFAVGLWVR